MGPQENPPKKLQIRSSTDQQPATNSGVRQGICGERTMRLHGANGPNQNPMACFRPCASGEDPRGGGGGGRETEAMLVGGETERETTCRPGAGGGGGGFCSMKQRRGGFGKKS
jgi:hypothetical protein